MCRESTTGARVSQGPNVTSGRIQIRDLSLQEAIHEVDSRFRLAHPWRRWRPSAGGVRRGEHFGPPAAARLRAANPLIHTTS